MKIENIEPGRLKRKALDERIGARLKLIRTGRGFTRRKVAPAMGLTYSQLAEIESGRRAARASEIVLFCEYVGTTLEVFYHKII